jgi:Major intrinsic protein
MASNPHSACRMSTLQRESKWPRNPRVDLLGSEPSCGLSGVRTVPPGPGRHRRQRRRHREPWRHRRARASPPGLMVMAIILFMGAVSGAYLNPAVTLGFALRGDFPWRRVPGYIIAELVGSTLAVLLLWGMFGKSRVARSDRLISPLIYRLAPDLFTSAPTLRRRHAGRAHAPVLGGGAPPAVAVVARALILGRRERIPPASASVAGRRSSARRCPCRAEAAGPRSRDPT